MNLILFHAGWLRLAWWRYLLAGCRGWRHFCCRVLCHPGGPVFHRSYGDEPDWHCRTCGDDLG